MRPIQQTIDIAAADDNGVATSQTPTTTVPLTIDGAYASGGVATLPFPAPVTLASASDMSGTVFTVEGTDENGVYLTEDVVGPNNSTVETTADFKTVTDITPVGGVYTVEVVIAGAADVGIGAGNWRPLDIYTPNQVTAVSCNLLNGTATYTVEYTNEDPFDPTITQLAAPFPAPELVAATGDVTAQTQALMRAVRVNVASGSGQLRATVTQQSTA